MRFRHLREAINFISDSQIGQLKVNVPAGPIGETKRILSSEQKACATQGGFQDVRMEEGGARESGETVANSGNFCQADMAAPKGGNSSHGEMTSVAPVELRLVRGRPSRGKLWGSGAKAHGRANFGDGGRFLHQSDETQGTVAAGAHNVNAEGATKQFVPSNVL